MRGEAGSSYQVVGNAWGLRRIWAGPGRVLGASWASPGQVLGILVSFWEALGLSWASWASPRRVLGCSWASWSALGQLLACLGRLLGTLGRLLSVLGRQVGAKMDPKRHIVDPKTLQNRSQDGTTRCYDIRSFSELHLGSCALSFGGHLVGSWARLGRPNNGKSK